MRSSQRMLTVLMAMILGSPALSGPRENKGIVTGFVLDGLRKTDGTYAPLPGVLVLAKSTNPAEAPVWTRTVEKGAYTLPIPLSAPYDLQFTLTGYDPCVIPSLKEREAQNICKVLYKTGQPRSLEAVHEKVGSVERVLFIAALLPSEQRRGQLATLAEAGLDSWLSVETPIVGEASQISRDFLKSKTDLLRSLAVALRER